MSSPDKVEFLKKAQLQGFRTYPYCVATEDPAINIARVQYRVETGGRSVPEDKITSRYARSLSLLSEAVRYADRAYILDNSGHEMAWFAEAMGGSELELKRDHMPAWFKAAQWDSFE